MQINRLVAILFSLHPLGAIQMLRLFLVYFLKYPNVSQPCVNQSIKKCSALADELRYTQNHSPGVTVAECNEQTVQGRKEKKKKLPATIYLKFSLFSTVCLLSVFDLHSTD
jgi:hypothetical protein